MPFRTSENEHMAKLLRQKSKILIAFGACANGGGIPALANTTSKDKIFTRVYKETPTIDNPKGTIPETKVQVKEGDTDDP